MATRERPILFSGPMVKAILEGRKTMTRRLVKNRHVLIGSKRPNDPFSGDDFGSDAPQEVCPYGEPGASLYVKEAWRVAETYDRMRPSEFTLTTRNVQYEVECERFLRVVEGRYRHARYMPRWASRITLLIKDVRVERLTSISEEDCLREGIEVGWFAERPDEVAVSGFRNLWDSINGKKAPWASNPWVWVIEFEVVK